MTRVVFIQLALGLVIGGGLGALMGYVGKCSTGTCPLTANPWRGAFFGAVIGGLFAFSAASSRAPIAMADGEQVAVRIASEAEFDRDVLNADRPVLVDFYSDSCPPCRRLAPTIETLAREYEGRAVVAKVDVVQVPALARRYGIQGIPAILFFVDGEPVGRMVGLKSKGAYTKVLDDLVS
jgi:thioredoxin 1